MRGATKSDHGVVTHRLFGAVSVRMREGVGSDVEGVATLRQAQLSAVHKRTVLAGSSTLNLALRLRGGNVRARSSSRRLRVLDRRQRISMRGT